MREPDPRAARLYRLIDVRSGRALWSLPRLVSDFHPWPRATISPGGRFALVSLPPSSPTQGVAAAGLVTMSRGEVLQVVETPSFSMQLQFADQGRLALVNSLDQARIYRLE